MADSANPEKLAELLRDIRSAKEGVVQDFYTPVKKKLALETDKKISDAISQTRLSMAVMSVVDYVYYTAVDPLIDNTSRAASKREALRLISRM